MLRKTGVSQLIDDLTRKMQLEKGIHNVKKIRRWKNRNGFHQKAYNKFKEVHGENITRNDFMIASWFDMLVLLEEYRTGITQKNKTPKPKWIQQ